ncbi:alr0857 family protein [Lyngbya confervoides]|uniref:Uncharacterized protein n=1 Tax=Lyngbya confervoides BDU141951 TaxID=1574623 RepID=A0ABD4SZM3_9CYAN|nr:alr0857 family protein [Lyngbya confervoides]MCM1981917.1 hypothetical protein [Lyngbya confervoides BDU141951]
MLKLIYTETGMILERVENTLESVIGQRLKLALSLGESFYLEPSSATILLTLEAKGYQALARVVQSDPAITTSVLDPDCVEVTLTGNWLAATAETESGIFLASLSQQTEQLLQSYWEGSELQVA